MPIGPRAHDGEGDQAVRVGERQRADQDRVHEREHGRIRTDGQREHGDDARRERGLLSDAANRLPKLEERHTWSVRGWRVIMKLIVFM